MRLMEFTNAEEQLSLLKKIFNNTWTGIANEAAEQKKQRELGKIARDKKKPCTKRAKTASSPRPARPAPLMPSKSTSAATSAACKSTATAADNKKNGVVQAYGQTGKPSVGPQQRAAKALTPKPAIRSYGAQATGKRYGATN